MFKRGIHIVYAIGVVSAAPFICSACGPQFYTRLDDFYDDANDHDVGDHKFDGLCDRLDVLGNGSWRRSGRGNYNIT